jgi:hypothetical protein
MLIALSYDYKQWKKTLYHGVSWLIHKFDTSAVIIGLIKVAVPYYEIKYFRIFWLRFPRFLMICELAHSMFIALHF